MKSSAISKPIADPILKSETLDTQSHLEDKVIRFKKPEIVMHWAMAVPFLICYTTALILILYFNQDSTAPFRDIVSWIHKISGICFIVLPLFIMFTSKDNFKLFSSNIKQAWSWRKDDFKWLSLMGLSIFRKNISLPEQGKYNAGEKLNFMNLTLTYPLYILSGILIWLSKDSLLFLLIHYLAAIIGTPFLLGHTFMALINPETRVALSVVFTGLVDRHYVKSHHTRWYKENFKDDEDPSGED